MPTISVILPVYNASEYLLEALESITNQTFTDWEMIAINDGSTDNSLEILQEYAKKEPRLRIISRDNRGLPRTLNEGIELAQGEYIARMDADDISLPERFEKQFDFLKNHNIDVCGTQHQCFGIQNNISNYPIKEEYCQFCLLFGSILSHPTVMAKATVLKNNAYNSNLKYAQDYDLWCRLSLKGYKMSNLSDICLKYRTTEQQIEPQKYHKQKSNAIAITKNYWASYPLTSKYCYPNYMRSYDPNDSIQIFQCIDILNDLKNNFSDYFFINAISNHEFLLLLNATNLSLRKILLAIKKCQDVSFTKKTFIILCSILKIAKYKNWLKKHGLNIYILKNIFK